MNKQQKQCIEINKKIDSLIESNKNKCITLLVHWNDYELIEFHTIETLMGNYSDITPKSNISHVSYSRTKCNGNKPIIYNTYDDLFKNISVSEIVEIHNMTIIRLS